MLRLLQTAMEEAKNRDHRVIGRAQGLFMFHDMSPGSAFMLPHGTRIYNTLLELMRQGAAGCLLVAGVVTIRRALPCRVPQAWVSGGYDAIDLPAAALENQRALGQLQGIIAAAAAPAVVSAWLPGLAVRICGSMLLLLLLCTGEHVCGVFWCGGAP